eukprot:XP_012818730.1 PREDICTED: dual specificity protein phosphatase 10 [Xenopus tropicalis]
MPPSPLDDRVIVALSRPVRPQVLNLCLDSSYFESSSILSDSHKSLLSTSVVCLNAANLTYMPSSTSSARSLGCGCSSASCCTVASYDKDSQSQAVSSTTITSGVSGPSASSSANQMVNNNENSGAKFIRKPHLGNQTSDKISRRRLQQGKITVLDLISCREGKDSFKRIFSKEIIVYDDNTNEPSRVMPTQPLHTVLESLKREGKEPLVLKGGLSSFKQNHESLCDNSLQLQDCSDGGGASAVSITLPQSIPTTPDIENAELTPILPFLYLGNEHDAQDLETMQTRNISYIVNVTTHLPLYHYEKGVFNYKRLPATDSNKQNLRQYFEEAFEFIDEAHQCGKALLIHCQAGVSRSATIVIAYLMKHTRMTMTDAYKFVKGKRPIISPNLNFMGQLLEFEEDLNNGITPRILTPKLVGVETVV